MKPGGITQVRAFRSILRRFEMIHKTLMVDRDCCCGLSVAQCAPLLELTDTGPMSLNDLAARLGLDKSTLSRTVEGLVQSGLVDRKTNRRDRRYVDLSLTVKGKAICDKINEQNDRLYEEVLSALPANNPTPTIRMFDDLVRTMAQVIGQDQSCCSRDAGAGT